MRSDRRRRGSRSGYWKQQRKQFRQQLSAMKGPKQYQHISIEDVVDGRLTPAYLAGFFDAEGTLRIYTCNSRHQIICSFSQANSPALLKAIHEYFDNKGSISESSVAFRSSSAAASVLCKILPYCCAKKLQIELFLRFLDGQETDVHKCMEELKRMKRL